MSFKTILACLTTEAAARDVMPAACAISREFLAHLTGIHTQEAIVPYPGIALHVDHPHFKAFNERVELEDARIQKIFKTHVSGEGFVSEWRTLPAQSVRASDQLVQSAFRSDLIIASQPNKAQERFDQLGVQKDLILNSGRPVILVPASTPSGTIGKRILIAWNATRESAAATHGALPFLIRAEAATILTVSSARPHSVASRTEGREVARMLARHDVHVEVQHVDQTEASVGAQILRQASVGEYDMVVMGGYGHPRLHSFFFGDATQFMLEYADRPVLYAS